MRPSWEGRTPFRLEISESTRLFVLSEMVNWFDLPNYGKGYPPGVEVWREVARDIVPSIVLRESNEGDPFIKCYDSLYPWNSWMETWWTTTDGTTF